MFRGLLAEVLIIGGVIGVAVFTIRVTLSDSLLRYAALAVLGLVLIIVIAIRRRRPPSA